MGLGWAQERKLRLRGPSPLSVRISEPTETQKGARQSSPKGDRHSPFPKTGIDAEKVRVWVATALLILRPFRANPQLTPASVLGPHGQAGGAMSSQKGMPRGPAPPHRPQSLSTRSGPLAHLLAEELAAHTAPEPRAGVGGPLAPRLLQRIQAAAFQGLAHCLQAAVGLGQDVGHAGGGGRAGPDDGRPSLRGQLVSGTGGRGVRSRWRAGRRAQLLEPRREAHGAGRPFPLPLRPPPRRRSVGLRSGQVRPGERAASASSPRRQRPRPPGSPRPHRPHRRK